MQDIGLFALLISSLVYLLQFLLSFLLCFFHFSLAPFSTLRFHFCLSSAACSHLLALIWEWSAGSCGGHGESGQLGQKGSHQEDVPDVMGVLPETGLWQPHLSLLAWLRRQPGDEGISVVILE